MDLILGLFGMGLALLIFFGLIAIFIDLIGDGYPGSISMDKFKTPKKEEEDDE